MLCCAEGDRFMASHSVSPSCPGAAMATPIHSVPGGTPPEPPVLRVRQAPGSAASGMSRAQMVPSWAGHGPWGRVLAWCRGLTCAVSLPCLSISITTSCYPLPSICVRDPVSDWFESLAQCLHWNVRKKQAHFTEEEEEEEEGEEGEGGEG